MCRISYFILTNFSSESDRVLYQGMVNGCVCPVGLQREGRPRELQVPFEGYQGMGQGQACRHWEYSHETI